MTVQEPGAILSEALADSEQAMPGLARWMYRRVRGHLGATVMDAGAGMGSFTELMLADGKRVIAVESYPPFVNHLLERFQGREQVAIHQGDLTDKNALRRLPPVDSVLCLNVLEHIEDDLGAMENLREAVRPGGTLVALVPAYPWLFNNMDRAVGHYRRYGRREFLQRLTDSGWRVHKSFRFNMLGLPGWFFAGSVLGRQKPGRDLARLYDLLVPVFSRLDAAASRLAGLSIVALCRRPEN
jgi:phospholipid N-methyltransferase